MFTQCGSDLDREGVKMGMCHSFIKSVSTKPPENKKIEQADETVIKQPIKTIDLSVEDLTLNSFSEDSFIIKTEDYEITWTELQIKYESICKTLGEDDTETIFTLKQMCSVSWSIFIHNRQTHAWEKYLQILYKRFKNDKINHQLKLDLLNSISNYLNSNTKVKNNEVLPLYDALYSNLSHILGNSHELTLCVLYFKGIHYYTIQRYVDSWNILESVYTKQLHFNLFYDDTIIAMTNVAEKLLHYNNLEGFLICMKVVEKLSLNEEKIDLLLLTIRKLNKIAHENINKDAGLKVFNDIIDYAFESSNKKHNKIILSCMLVKAQYLVSMNDLDDAWVIVLSVCKITNNPLPKKPIEKYIMQSIVCDLICKIHSNYEKCNNIHIHPFTPEHYDIDLEQLV